MDKKTAFILKPLKPGDIDSAMKLSNAEGWNQTAEDWKLLIENPGNICMAAECDGKIIGTTIAVNYSNQVAWISMVLVDREYRGQGVSKSLLSKILKQSESFKSIKLDATPEGQQVYKKFDFKDEYLIARMINSSVKDLPRGDDNDISEPIQLKHIQEIIALDEIVFGANRTKLIKFLIKECPGKAWLVKRNNQITGFALGRDGNKYHHIGPVVAANTADGKALIAKVLKKLSNEPVVADVLCEKEDLIAWLNSIGFVEQRHFIRMYRKENKLPGITGKQYLICGPEFG